MLKMRFKRLSNFRLYLLVIVVLSSVFVSYQYFKKNQSAFWTTTDKFSGVAVNPNFKARFDIPKNKGGITIFPKNYQQGTKNVKLQFTSRLDAEIQEKTIFEKIPEFTHYSAIPDNKASEIWIVQQQNEECITGSLEGDIPNEDQRCNISLFKFDLATSTLDKITEFNVADNIKQYAHVQPIAVDDNNVWLALTHDLSRTFDEKEYVADILIRVAKVDNNPSYYHFGRIIPRNIVSPYVDGFSNKIKVADIDKDGNLFVLVEGLNENEATGVKLYKLNPNNNRESYDIEIPTYNLKRPLFTMQLIVNKAKDRVYLVDRTWDGNKDSYFWEYDIRRKTFELLGGMPTRIDDDVRGLSIINGNLAVGFFDGLGLYNPDKNKWTIYGDKEGLKQNAVETIELFTNNKFCVVHEKDHMSCLRVPFSVFRLFGL